MFYEIYSDLCKSKGVSLSKAAEQIGLSRTSVVKWKSGTTPSGATLTKIADYFGVSVDYLLGNEQKEKPAHFVQAKKRLRSVARLEESLITPEQDEEICSIIDVLLKKEKGNK